MGIAESIINGTYGKKKKEEEYSTNTVADSIINGTYNSQPESSQLMQVQQTVQQPSLLNNLGYVGESTGAGIVSGVTGIVDAPLQNMQEGAEKADTKSLLQNAKEIAIKKAVPFGSIPDKVNDAAKIIQDKDMSAWKKALNIAMEFMGMGGLTDTLQTAGQEAATIKKLVGQDALKEIKQAREVVETPSNKLNEIVAEDSQDRGKGWQIAGQVGQTIGNMAPSIAASVVSGNPELGLSIMGASAKGQATKEAEERGADISTANNIGLAKGLTEIATEKATGGLKIFGKGTADDIVEGTINKVIKNRVGNFVAKQGAGILGEVGEEIVSDLVGTAIDKATVDPNASYSVDDALNTALMTLLSTGVLNTISGGYGKRAYQLNKQELMKYEKVQDLVNQKVQEQTTKDMTPQEIQGLRTKIENEVTEEVENELNEVFKSNIQAQEQPINQNIPQLPNQTQFNTLNQGVLQENNQTLVQEQTPQITPLNQVNQELQETRQNDIADSVKAMNLEKQPEFTQKQGNYVYEKSNNSKIDTFRKDAATYLKAGEQTDNFVKTLEKIIEDKDIEIRFDPNLRDSQGRMVNGSYSNNVITLNPNSNRAGEFLAIHELTHAIGTKSMINMIQKYRKSNAEFDSAVKRLLTTYKTTEINEEALGDIAGQLFGNQEYINNLSMENPSLFKRIYNEIKYLWHQFTGYKNQDQFIEDLRNKWESAYRNSKVKQTTKTGYSLEERVSGDKLLDTQDLINEIKDVGAEVDDNGYVTVYHQTTDENAQKIRETGQMISKEPSVFFSTSKNASQSDGRGTTKLEFKIPAEELELDDLFSDNADVKIRLNGKNSLDVSNYLIDNTQDMEYNKNDPEYIGLIAARPEIEKYTKYTMNKEFLNKPIKEIERISEAISRDSIKQRNKGKTQGNYYDINSNSIYTYDIKNQNINYYLNNITHYTEEMESVYEEKLGKSNGTNEEIRNNRQSNLLVSDGKNQNSKTISTNDGLLNTNKEFNRGTSNEQSNRNIKELDNSSFSLQKKYDDIVKQRDKLKEESSKLYDERKKITDKISNYSMFKQYEETTNIDKLLDENKQKSLELYEKQKQLEKQLKEVKQQEKQKKIDEVNKNVTPHKQKQYDILQKTNPMLDEYHTGIRQPGEIKTWNEAMQDAEQDGEGYSWGDFSKEDAEKTLKNNSIKIYSSYPIKNGVFVSTSFDQAKHYAGGDGSKVYSKTINPDEVAWINVDEGQYAKVDTKYSKENNEWASYVESSFKDKPLTQSNTGKKLSKKQEQFFKDTKVRDNNGNLITVYHTTTNAIPQFNEFNPVGTDYYKFGDQVVNYFTNDKNMSGSYADQDYVMADTSKISSMNEVNKLIEEHNNNLNPDEKYDYNVEIVKAGDGYKLKVTSQPGASYSGVIEEFYPRKYKNDIDLFKEIKNDLKNYRTIRDENGRALSNDKKIQYEGYVNITNPYVVDAEKRNWNQVVSQSNEFIDDLDERVPDDIKNNLTRLYRESENKSAEARENYNVLENIINQGIDGYNSSVDKDVRKVNKIIKRVGYDEIEDLLNYDGQMGIMGVRGWYNLSDALKEQDLIGDSTSKLIIDEFKLPENLKEYIKENYTKEIPLHHIQFNDMDITKAMNQLGKSTTLQDIYNKNQENYNEFDKYRMPNSYFLEELKKDGNDYLGYDLEDMFETRAEVMGADTVADEISQAASVGFSKPELIRLWGTSKTTNDVVKEIIASNKDGKTNYDGVIIKNVYDYGGKSDIEKNPNDLYVTFNSNQFKNVDNTNPTEDPDIRYSKDNKTWREYLEKEFTSQGTRTNLQDINERNKKLTEKEKTELDGLKALYETGLMEETDADYKRMQELEKKQQGITTKFPELKKTVTQDDTKSLYFKYKNNEISKENRKILNEAKKIVESNKQNRRTKEQWLQVAEYIGANANVKSSQDLQRLAMETWLESKPNNRENLNRQGKKYIEFKTNEWFNAMYKGAGVGTDVKMSLEEATDNKGKKVDLKPIQNNTYEKVNTRPKKNEIISKDDIVNEVLNIGDKKVSNFYSNATEKSKFITEENRVKLMDNDTLKYYDAINNKETLQDALNKLDSNTEKQIGDFFTKKEFTAEDVATGWILVKRYQDAGNFEAMSNVIERMRQQGTKAGQTIQMYGMLERLTPEGMEYYSQKQLDNAFNEFSKNKSKKQIEKYANDFTLTAEEHQFIKDTMEKVQNMTDDNAKKVEIAKIVSMLSDKLPPEKGSRLKSWMRISMLGNPKTQVRNIVGNAIIQPVNWVGDVFSSVADKLVSKKTGVRTKGATDFGALARGTKQGFKESIRDAKLGIDTRDINLNRFEENIGAKPFYEKHTGAAKVLNPVAKGLNKVNKILSNVMSGGDRVFYQGIYENSLQNQMKLNKVEVPTQEMIDIAEQEALQRTWNDSNEYTKAVLQIRNAMNKINVKGYGLGDVLVPFAKTPANLTKAIVDYSPLGLTRTILSDGRKLKNSLQNGQYNAQLQHKFADSLGKGFAGTLLWAAAYGLAKAGITSGASDDDKDVANFMRNTLGIQPYSVKVGDKSFTYDWAQPIAAPFAMMADIESKKNNTKDEQDLLSYIKTAGNTGLNILLDQSFLSSIQDVFNSYDGPGAAIQQQIEDLPARATPTFFKQIADLIDPKSRQTYVKGDASQTLKNKVQVKIPGASKELTAQRDTLGREIEKYGGNDNTLKYAFNVFLNPANTNKGKPSEAAEEIYAVYKATGDKTIMPRQVGYSENIGGTTRNLTAKERNEWQRLSGEKIEKNVKALTQNEKYNSMSNEDKAAVINGIVNYSFAKAKSDLFNTNISTMYKTAAKKEEQGIPLYDYYIDRISKRK